MHDRVIRSEYIPDVEKLIKRKRVCAYARVSSDRDEAFHSLSAQISYYQQKIAEHPDWEFVEVFSDRGITGTKENRPGFQAMLTACREHRVDIVLAKSITRFARNTVILLETVRELKGLGIDIHFEEEHIETLGAKGEFMISILAARAQEESRSASENQLWRIRKSYEKGIPVTGNCLGYRMVDHQFLIDEEEEQIVLRIFSMYLSGMGTTAIAKQLNAEGIPTRLHKRWNSYGVSFILRNEKYSGDLHLQKSYVDNHLNKKTVRNHGERQMYKVSDDHDAIIDKAIFEATQQEISRRAKKHNRSESVTLYPFSGLITCGKCNKHFGRKIGNSGTQYQNPSWACRTWNQLGKQACSMTQRIPESKLIEASCQALEIDEFDEEVLRNKVKAIVVPDPFTLDFYFLDGTIKRVLWQYRSRSESWTPEIKEAARQKAIAQHEAKKRKGDSNGS